MKLIKSETNGHVNHIPTTGIQNVFSLKGWLPMAKTGIEQEGTIIVIQIGMTMYFGFTSEAVEEVLKALTQQKIKILSFDNWKLSKHAERIVSEIEKFSRDAQSA